MLVQAKNDAWSEPIAIVGPVMVQARTDGEVYLAWSQDGAMPDGPTEGLRLRDGERELLGFLASQHLRVHRGEGTAFAEVFIGQWYFAG